MRLITKLLLIATCLLSCSMDLSAKSFPERVDLMLQEDSEVMHYEQLTKYIDITIPGYEKQEPEGATMNLGGNSYSTATIKFLNSEGDRVTLSLFDYNKVSQLYMAASMMWTQGFSIDTPEEKANGIEISEHVRGWESYKKKEKKSTIILGVGERFIFSIEAENKTTDFCRDIIKKVDLEGLATK